jgi:hypothetical protein
MQRQQISVTGFGNFPSHEPASAGPGIKKTIDAMASEIPSRIAEIMA